MKILCLGKIPQDLEDKLTSLDGLVHWLKIDRAESLSAEEMRQALTGVDILLTEPQDNLRAEVIGREAHPKLALKMIAQRAVGYDNIDMDICRDRGILVSNTPGVLDNATADLAFALLLASARRIVEADNYVRAGRWEGFESDLMLGKEISGKTLGIVGLGRIGKAMARRAWGFGLNIIYHRGNFAGDKDLEKILAARSVSLDELLKESDFVSLHCPLRAETTGLIGEAELSKMKPGATLINTARGKVLDQEALVKAVSANKIFAALDVFKDEPQVPNALINSQNVVLAPHIGSATVETRYNMAKVTVEAVIAAAAGQVPANSINPETFALFLDRFKGAP